MRSPTLFGRLVALFLASHILFVAGARAEHDEPKPEPTKGEPEPPNTGHGDQHEPGGEQGGERGGEQEKDEDRPLFDEEADYLALADAPIFLPRSYLYWGTPVGPKRVPGARTDLVFALEYALHLSIYSNVRSQALDGKRWAGAVTLSFEGDLRMLGVESKPVRMPSYRPNLSGQLFYVWHRAQPMLFGLRSGVYHYSNGQEQCTFDEKLTDDSAECLALTDAVTDPERALNRKNGNFSSNGWLLELNGRAHQVNSKGVAIGHLAVGISVAGMIHKGPGAMEPALERLYGWGRVAGSFEAKKRFGWAAMTVRSAATYFPRSRGPTPDWSGNVEVVLGPYWLTGLGFFGRYYGGRDYYNAFFVDRLQQLSAGISWDGERPLKFKRTP